MSKLVIKTGMQTEQQIATRYAVPGTLVLTGQFDVDALDKAVPSDCEALLSFGVCGALAPDPKVGQAFLCEALITLGARYLASSSWGERLSGVTKYPTQRWYSSGQFKVANTIEQRAQLFAQTGCWLIDDETYAVAQLAARRGIAFQALRTVSDGAEDNLPPAVLNALNPDGTDNLREVIESVVTDPLEIPALIRTALEAKRAFDELETAAIAAGPSFQWTSAP